MILFHAILFKVSWEFFIIADLCTQSNICLLNWHNTQYTYPLLGGEASWRRTDERHLPWIDWTASWFCWLSWVPDDGEWWCRSGQGCPSHLNTQTTINVYISTHFKCLAIVSLQYLRQFLSSRSIRLRELGLEIIYTS